MRAIGEKKVYWHGLSSGTHTAHTFAALYPEAVGKLSLDAVVQSNVAYSITSNQPSTIVDLELTLEAFFITCNAAGASCPFKGSSTSAKQLNDRSMPSTKSSSLHFSKARALGLSTGLPSIDPVSSGS
ncbi:hypothetical protein DPSP01_004864 [Paraphaeosphaeria sporulosa]